jgi:hypothetical protein
MVVRDYATHLCDRLMCVRDGHEWIRVRAKLGETVVVRSQCYRCGTVGHVEGAWKELGNVP